jgi:hypothetical protein
MPGATAVVLVDASVVADADVVVVDADVVVVEPVDAVVVVLVATAARGAVL